MQISTDGFSCFPVNTMPKTAIVLYKPFQKPANLEVAVSIKKPHDAAKRAEGSLTEALGKLNGDKVVEAMGAAKMLESEVEQAAADRSKPGKK